MSSRDFYLFSFKLSEKKSALKRRLSHVRQLLIYKSGRFARRLLKFLIYLMSQAFPGVKIKCKKQQPLVDFVNFNLNSRFI